MRGLIIGQDGLIGSAFMRSMPHDNVMIGTTRRSTGDNSSPGLQLDLNQPKLAIGDEWFPREPFDFALFAAAISNINQCAAEPGTSRRVNVENTLRVLEALRKRRIFTVFLSTNMVFDGSVPHTAEDAPPCPQTDYGRQKVVVENWMQEYFPGSAIVRLSKVLGGSKTIFSTWAAQLRKGESVRAFSDLSIAPVLLETVCDSLEAIIRRKAAGIFQISGDEEVYYGAIGRELANRLGVDPGLVQAVPAREAAYKLPLPKYTSLSTRRIQELTGQPLPSSADALGQFLGRLAAGPV